MTSRLFPASRLFLLVLAASSTLSLTSCGKRGAPTSPPVTVGTNYVEFNLAVSYLSSFDRTTGTYDLEDRGQSFISLKNKESYRLRGGEASSRQRDIDFVYDVSSSVRTGQLSNTGFYMPRVDGFAKSPFGPNWTDWNTNSLITNAYSTRAFDPVTGFRLNLSDEEFDSIRDGSTLAVVNLGNNPGVPTNTPLSAQATFDIGQDGKTEKNNYFIFKLRSGERGVLRISKEQNAASLNIKVKMLS